MSVLFKLCLLAAVVFPVVLLMGIPSLTPAWLRSELGGVPTIIWLTLIWFVVLTLAAWLPDGKRQ